MLHDDSADDFFLYSILLPHLQLYLAIRNASTFPPLLHGWSDFILTKSVDPHALQHRAVHERHKFQVIVGLGKIEDAESLVAALIDRRLDNPVNGGFVVTSGLQY